MNRLTSSPASRQRATASATLTLSADDIQAPLGRQLGPALGHERDLLGPVFQGDGDDRGFDGQLQVEPALHGLAEQAEVAILDVAAILTKMNRDAIGATKLGLGRRPDRVRLATPSGLPERRDVVDVHSQTGHRSNLPRSPQKPSRATRPPIHGGCGC